MPSHGVALSAPIHPWFRLLFNVVRSRLEQSPTLAVVASELALGAAFGRTTTQDCEGFVRKMLRALDDVHAI